MAQQPARIREFKKLYACNELGVGLITIADGLERRAKAPNGVGMAALDVWADCQSVMKECLDALRNAALLDLRKQLTKSEADDVGAVVLHVNHYLIQALQTVDDLPEGDDLAERAMVVCKRAFVTADAECSADLIRLGSRLTAPLLADAMNSKERAGRPERAWTAAQVANEATNHYTLETGVSPKTKALRECLIRTAKIAMVDLPKADSGDKDVLWPESKLQLMLLSFSQREAVGAPVHRAVLALLQRAE